MEANSVDQHGRAQLGTGAPYWWRVAWRVILTIALLPVFVFCITLPFIFYPQIDLDIRLPAGFLALVCISIWTITWLSLKRPRSRVIDAVLIAIALTTPVVGEMENLVHAAWVPLSLLAGGLCVYRRLVRCLRPRNRKILSLPERAAETRFAKTTDRHRCARADAGLR